MTRVSQNSSNSALNFSINKVKKKLEDLQLKGSTLKDITRPSDNPIYNIETQQISSRVSDNEQYMRNSNYALLNLNITESTIEQLSDIVSRAKELAIAQASDTYNASIRNSVSNEVKHLYKQALSLANKRLGNRYIFGGFKTLDPPFNSYGIYVGDGGNINLEVSKDLFVQVGFNGSEVFYTSKEGASDAPEESFEVLDDEKLDQSGGIARSLASVAKNYGGSSGAIGGRNSILSQLSRLTRSLELNDADSIRGLLTELDDSMHHLTTLRTKIGSIENSVTSAKNTMDKENLSFLDRKSKLEDVDVVELFSEIARQKNALKASYQASNNVISNTLLDFLR